MVKVVYHTIRNCFDVHSFLNILATPLSEEQSDQVLYCLFSYMWVAVVVDCLHMLTS